MKVTKFIGILLTIGCALLFLICGTFGIDIVTIAIVYLGFFMIIGLTLMVVVDDYDLTKKLLTQSERIQKCEDAIIKIVSELAKREEENERRN